MMDQDEWMKIATSDEPLDPALAGWMEETDFMGEVLKHPLVFQIPFHSAGLANYQYKWKKEELAKAKREKNWNTYIFLHERPYRINAFLDTQEEFDDATYWELVADIWTDSENIWQNEDDWIKVLSCERPGRLDHMMDEEDREVYDNLPDEVTVYRGCSRELNEDGMSWTTDHAKAEWFAKRWMSHKGDGIVVHGTVSKDKIVAYTNGRNESEIIVAFPEHVQVVRYEVFETPMTVEMVDEQASH